MLEYRPKIVGSKYFIQGNEKFLKEIKDKEITLEREPSNLFDRNAIKCLVDGIQIGYIERSVAARMSVHLEHAESHKVHFSDLDWMNVVVGIVPGREDPVLNEIHRREDTNKLRKKVHELSSKLHIFCRAGEFEKAKATIDILKKTDISPWYYLNSGRPVYLATIANNISLVMLLVEAGFKHNDERYRSLRYSIKNNRKDLIDFFISQGVSKAGRTYALIEAHIANNEKMIENLWKGELDSNIMSAWAVELVKTDEKDKLNNIVKYAKSSGFLSNALLEAASTDRAADLSVLLRLQFKESQLGRALNVACKRGATHAVSTLLDTVTSEVIIRDAIFNAIEHDHREVLKTLVSKGPYSKKLEAVFLHTVIQGNVELAILLHELGAYVDQPQQMANDLLDATIIKRQVRNYTLRKLYDLLPQYLLIKRISELKTKNQLSSLFVCTNISPLDAAVRVTKSTLRNYCIEVFKSNVNNLYKMRGGENLELLKCPLGNTELPKTIVQKLSAFQIDNVYVLLLVDEAILRDLIGLERVEVNEILYFLEENNFDHIDCEKYSALEESIENLDLSPRTNAILIGEDISSVGDLVKLTASDLRKIIGLGKKSIEEISQALSRSNLSLKMDLWN